MHESVVAWELLRTVEERARASGADRVVAVGVRIGALSGLVPEALSFAFEALQVDTFVAGAKLDIERIEALCQCERCGLVFPVEETKRRCVACGIPAPFVPNSDCLLLTRVEVE